mgnify:CR=1 FL=1
MDFLIHHMLQSTARRQPKKIALKHAGRSLTYEEILNCASGLSANFTAMGIKRLDRVGIYLDHSVELVLSIFGLSKAGAAFVPINGQLLPEQVWHIAQDCEMRGLITTNKRLNTLREVIERLPKLEFLIIIEDGSNISPLTRTYWFHELLKIDGTSNFSDCCIGADLAAILYTSGSTGKPKGVMLTHSNIVAGTSIVSMYLEISENDSILSILPFSFDAGLNQLMSAFQQGATLVLMTFMFSKEIVKMLIKERITGLAGVPTLWTLLSQSNSTLEGNSFSDLRYITNTGGAMPQNVLSILRKALPRTRVFLMYGLTEAFRSTYLSPDELDRRPTSMGKAIPNTEILIVTESNEPAKPWEVGELVHRGPTVSLGYWGFPELTDKILRKHPFLSGIGESQEKLCYSGDLVKMDEEGFLYFVGRRDSMIKSSGFRISRTEVEAVIYQSSMVKEAAVIGVPDEILGQAVKAFVVSNDNEPLILSELSRICLLHLPRYMMPKTFNILSRLPKTPNGKIDYTKLEAMKVESDV